MSITDLHDIADTPSYGVPPVAPLPKGGIRSGLDNQRDRGAYPRWNKAISPKRVVQDAGPGPQTLAPSGGRFEWMI